MRNTIIHTILLIMPLLSSAQHQPGIDILHYKFAISLEDSVDRIEGNATILFKCLVPENEIMLDLTSEDTGKGMQVESVTVNRQTEKYVHQDNKLIIHFSNQVNPGDTAEINIRYAGIPANGLIISKNKYGNRTFFSDNWPDRAHHWIPCIDEPADKATVEFMISAPKHYNVISNGILVEESNLNNNRKFTHWKEDMVLATKIMVIGVADFDVQLSGTVQGIPVTSWVFPENREKGFYDYAQAAEILPYYIKTYGPYGYKKLANIQSKTMYGGVENAGAIFYAENSITGTRKSEALLAHEIAHQWFGDMATETKFAHLWLSEGFATYMTALYMQNKYGRDTLTYMLKRDRQRVVRFSKTYDHPVVDTTVTDYMKLLNANSYQKGGWVLHMLHRMLGDTVFYRSIRKYYATYAGRNASTENIRSIFESVSGKKLEPFFKQWLYTPGQPDVTVTWIFQPAKKRALVTVIQNQKDIFQFPLQVQVKKATGKDFITRLQITRQKEEFVIPVNQKPDSLILDPDTSLLFEGTASEGGR